MSRSFSSRPFFAAGTALVVGACSSVNYSAERSDNLTVNSPLVYESVKRFEGLDESVLIHKGPDGVWCRRADGQIQDCESVREYDRAAYFAQYGVMSKALATAIAQQRDTDIVSANVLFDVVPPSELNSPNMDVRAHNRKEFSAKILSEGKRLQDWIESRHGQITDPTNDTMPFFVMEGPASIVKEMSRLPGVVRVMEVNHDGNTSIPTASGPTDSITFSLADSVYNSTGNYGQNFNVGILGAGSQLGCSIWNGHQAFASTTVTESDPTQVCTNDADCALCGGRCISGGCMDPHETGVGSVIAVGRDSSAKYGAAQASLFHYNRANVQGCGVASARSAYAWFLTQHVFVVNESFDCTGTYGTNATQDGLAQDYYTRVYDISVVRAAGNTATLDPTKGACEFTLNAICVGGVTHNNTVNCLSTRTNPRGRDREEPDVMALAGAGCAGEDSMTPGVDIADVTRTPSDWTRSTGGTSFAAPQVAQLLTLYNQSCGGDERQLRSYVRNSAYAANPLATAYSTPGLGIDYADGTGVVRADTLGACASANTPTQGTFGSVITLTAGGPAPFAADCPACGHPLSVEPLRTGVGFSPTDGRQYIRIAAVPAGAIRFRASLSWDSCTSVNATTAPGAPSVDFDLFLVDTRFRRVIYSSQSNDDNNEGFDVDLRQFGSGTYSVYRGWPNGAHDCTGGTAEKIGFSWKSF